jgi:hypothetical protein
MGICNSKEIRYIEPSVRVDNIINFFSKADKEFITRSSKFAHEFIENEELKKEYHYIRKVIIVAAFLKDLPKLFNNDYDKMKLFLNTNKIPPSIYNIIYNYHNKKDNKKDNQLIKYKINMDNIDNIDDIYDKDEYIKNSLNTIRSYIYDIILI